jgi:hypothetical protein
VLGAANADVIAADNLLDLAVRTRAVIDEPIWPSRRAGLMIADKVAVKARAPTSGLRFEARRLRARSGAGATK